MSHRRSKNVPIAAVAIVALIVGAGGVWVSRAIVRSKAPTSVVETALRAADARDQAGFRRCFDRLPVGTDVTGFADTLAARYGKFQSARRTGAWTAPTSGSVSSARFQASFDRATLSVDVTVRSLVDEASSTGDTSFLGQSRIVRLVIRDPTAADVVMP